MHDVYMCEHACGVRGQLHGVGLLIPPLGRFWVTALIGQACIVNNLTCQAILLALYLSLWGPTCIFLSVPRTIQF